MPVNSVPARLTAGTTISYKRSFADYPASAGWSYSLAMRITGYVQKAAEADGDDFVMTFTPADSASWKAGTYSYSERISLGDDVFEVGSGKILVRDNLSAATAKDGRTHAERTLLEVEAAIESRMASGITSYSIGGRTVSKVTLPELLKMRDYYRVQVAIERRGGGNGTLGTVLIKFDNK